MFLWRVGEGYEGNKENEKFFLIEIECDGDIDVEGMKELLKDMMDNQVNCTEMTISVSEKTE